MVSIERLDQALFSSKSPADIKAFLAKHKNEVQLYFNATDPVSDTALIEELTARISNPELKVLYEQTQTEFGNADQLAGELSEAFANIKRDFPDFRPPRVATLITGFLGPDLVVTDSLIIIGLDYFAGPKAKYRPRGEEFPQYILRRYAQPYIVPTIVRLLSDRFNTQDRADQSLLADMVYNGKSLVFTRTMLPEIPDSLIIGYSDRQLTETFNAQDQVWAHFIDNQLLYQTNADIKKRYMGERPFTVEIGNRCPGRIGDWLGWRIASRYYDEKKVSIPDLMKTADARRIFQESGYKGQKDEL
uniref:gliding motility lipoprotein GldB n=1 Tax=Fibrella forsythiae TaxID=2817061 RepID=UPI00286D8C87|nr:gliding motility protein [Fibrella forsythiae]